MAFEHYVRSGDKLLRCGYTTGSCAALAAAGAARLLLTGAAPRSLTLTTPAGLPVTVSPVRCEREGNETVCAVIKDGGDDPDATHGAVIEARVRRVEGDSISIDGGPGVGRVTLPGLDQPPGAAAINRVPRAMIAKEVEAVRAACGETGGLAVTICVPGGEKLAQKTFNPHMGIVGGISILGTTGIVEPMSEQALLDTIALDLRQAAARGEHRVILTPGHYGEAFLRALGPAPVPVVCCSNFIGDSLDEAAVQGFAEILLVGHAGKLVKLAGSVMNTHSRTADCRAELLCAHAAVCGADTDTCRALMATPTVDAALAVLDAAGLRALVLASLLAAIDQRLARRAGGAYRVGAALFTNQYGLLGLTAGAKEIVQAWNMKLQ